MSFIWVRKHNEQTTDYLGRVLTDLELHDMARRAREGHFDDYFAPKEVATGFELIQLVKELHEQFHNPEVGAVRKRAINAVIDKVKTGEFDATKEESDRWAASKDGQDAMRMLLPERDR